MSTHDDDLMEALNIVDSNIDSISLRMAKFEDELLRLNSDLVNRKGSKKNAVKAQIKNVEQALRRLEKEYKRANKNVKFVSKIGKKGVIDKVVEGALEVLPVVSQLKSADAGDDKPDDNQNKESFFAKYKYFIFAGAGLLFLLLFLGKKK